MMKKKIALLGAALMGISLLSGCGASYSTRLPDYSEYVTLGSYENLEYVPATAEVSDEDVQYELDSFVEGLSTEKEITDRAAELGDNINIDYVGRVDGVEFDGGSTDGAGTDIVLGESGYIDNFDDQIVGMKPGETKDVVVTFPDPYENDDTLSGKEAVFETTLNKITETETPELTDQLVADNTDFDTIDAYKEDIRTRLQADAEQDAKDSDTDSLLSAATANATFSKYPEDEIKTLIDDTISEIQSTASAYGIDYETYINYFYGCETEADFEEYLADSAKSYMEQRMVVCAIARKEKISVSDEEIETYVKELMDEYELDSADDVYEYYTDADLEYMLLVDKVGELLKKTAVEVASTEGTTEEELEILEEDADVDEGVEDTTAEAAEDATADDTAAEDTDVEGADDTTAEDTTEAADDTTTEAAEE